jgi:hypothetical protein
MLLLEMLPLSLYNKVILINKEREEEKDKIFQKAKQHRQGAGVGAGTPIPICQMKICFEIKYIYYIIS